MAAQPRMLNGTLTLHGVDIEAIARAALNRRYSNISNLHVNRLTDDQHERLLSFLIIAGWQTAERYDPHRTDAIPFRHMVMRVMRCRVVDWLRHEYGDNRRARQRGERYANGHAPTRSLDELVADQANNPGEDNDIGTVRLGDTLATSALDPQECSDIDCSRLLGNRSSELTWAEPHNNASAYAATA